MRLLSRLGPLVSPSAIYSPSGIHSTTAAAPPRILVADETDFGLGLAVASSPADVLKCWVLPNLEHLENPASRTSANSDWFVGAAAHLMTCWSECSSVSPKLPIVLENGDVLPDGEIAFVPPWVLPVDAGFENDSGGLRSLERQLMRLYLESDGKRPRLPSVEYRKNSEKYNSNYFEFFTNAGEDFRRIWFLAEVAPLNHRHDCSARGIVILST